MKNNKLKIGILLILLLLATGCTVQLKDSKKKPVTNPTTGQSLTKNILCQPKDKKIRDLYKENEKQVNINKLPTCDKFEITQANPKGLGNLIWESIFIKPLAFLILKIGYFVKSFGLSLILTSLLIRLVAFPITKKTALQSEMIKKAKPELDKLEKKYKDKKDQASMMKKSQEMTMIYKKHNINPIGGCLFAIIQLPIFIAFLEAINRTPAIFEDKFLGLQLGTTPMTAFNKGHYLYILLIILVGVSTYISFKMTTGGNTDSSSSMQPKNMTNIMVITIVFMSLFMSSALGIYWITSNLFTIGQNLIVKRSKI